MSDDTASEKCQQEKRKTVNGEDILFAMTSLGFENYAEALKIYLSKYREVSCSLFLIISPGYTSRASDPGEVPWLCTLINHSCRHSQQGARTRIGLVADTAQEGSLVEAAVLVVDRMLHPPPQLTVAQQKVRTAS